LRHACLDWFVSALERVMSVRLISEIAAGIDVIATSRDDDVFEF
jgi:hypothetical protein